MFNFVLRRKHVSTVYVCKVEQGKPETLTCDLLHKIIPTAPCSLDATHNRSQVCVSQGNDHPGNCLAESPDRQTTTAEAKGAQS